ncbi:tripartite tricarboxylate transporter substrate binding protein [Malikia sp.]|uniref:tripartite tricarboxylate transporter substrate binding protein n=1 Tax=Malikia sp. TaxID=2070706 RepID=UPI00260657E8|nr:tripartite tricarboxylate transporter substrate binding protein [Malikia sp.]MDD2728049.1 tripartite tricarboxylate transporter substrate binding protein [Malikia sp.]
MNDTKQHRTRRAALQRLLTLAGAGLGWGTGQARSVEPQADAPAWPLKPVTLIVPWSAGGGTDLSLRVLAEEAAAHLGQPVIVANRPGAAGTMVAPLLKAAVPDGHTIGQLPVTVFRHALMNRVAWNPVTDLAPILQVSGTTFGLLVPAASPWKRVSDLLDWAAAHPGELLLGSTGIGSTPHLVMEELLLDHGIRYTHVPYKGTTDQMLALASGTIMAGMNSTGFAPWVDQGKLRLLALFGERRSPRWPTVPTMGELGFRHAVHHSPWGLAAPAATPVAALDILHQAFRQAMFTPRHLAELARYDQEPAYLGPADYRAALADAVLRERRMLERMRLLVDPSPRQKGDS